MATKSKYKVYKACLQNQNNSREEIEYNFQADDIHAAYDEVRSFQDKNPDYYLTSLITVYN